MSIGSENSREKEVNFCSQGSGSDATVYLESASLGRHFPSCSRGWMQFANCTRPGHELLSVHQGVFLAMAVKPGDGLKSAGELEGERSRREELAQTCMTTGWLEQQQKKAGRAVLCFWNKAECLESVCFWLRKGTEQL